MVTDPTAISAEADAATLAQALRDCFGEQRFDDLDELYAEDADLELHVGPFSEHRRGSDAIRRRYAADYAEQAVFHRWDVRSAPWGCVIEAEASQHTGTAAEVHYRWAQLLTVVGGRIVHDVVYCTGAVPATR